MRSGRFHRNPSLTNHGHRALRHEDLESRQLLSVSPVGSEVVVGPATNDFFDEFYKDLAVDAAGNVTVVWERFVEEQRLDIFARRYDAAGNPLGSEFRVNAYTAGDQSKPAIAVNDAGQTVITWQSNQQDGDGWGIYASFYDAGGSLLSGDVLVNTTTAGDAVNPDVDISNAGRVMFAWGPYSTFRFFDASGNAEGDEFGEVFATDRNYIGFDAAGGYVRGGFGGNVFEWRRYTANDVQVPDTVFTVTNRLTLPVGSASYDFAMNSSGEFIAASFAKNQVHVQRVSATDELLDLPVTVPTIVNLPQFDVDLDEAGNLAVGTINIEWDSASSSWTSVHVFNADNTLNDVLTFAHGQQMQTQTPAVAFTGIGAGVILHNLLVPGQPDYAILTAQRFATDSLTITGLVGAGMEFLRDDVIAPVEVRELEVRLSRAASTAAGLHSVLNPANWQLWRGNENVSSLIATIGYADGRVKLTLAAALPTGNYRLVASDAIQDSEGNALDGNGDGLPGGAAERRFVIGAVQPVGNPIKTDTRQAIDIASNSSGQFATVTLRSSQIRAQFFDAQGVPIGSELRLASNVAVTSVWTKPHAFLDEAANLHVYWREQTGNYFWGTYNSAGVLQRPIVALPQNTRSVDMGQDGRVVVLASSGLYLFNSDGTPAASVIPAETLGLGSLHDVAFLASGEVVVAGIQSAYQQDYQLFTRRLSASGELIDVPRLVAASSNQINNATLSANSEGGFAVGWQSTTVVPPSLFDPKQITTYLRQINVRLFDANATPLGAAILVASDTVATPLADNPALVPEIDFDDTGRFVIAWQQADLDGNLSGIGARGYLADGTPMGPAFRVNVPQVGVQSMPALAVNSGGQLAIGWLDQGLSRAQFFELFELPTVDLNGDAPGLSFAQEYTPSDFARPLAGELAIDAAGYGSLFGAEVRIRSFVSGDVLLVDASGTSLSATFENGLLTINGEADRATYERVLRTVRFEAAPSRSTGDRIAVDFQVDFGVLTSAVSTAALALYLPGSVSIVNRSLFYNNSAFDGSEQINARDELARATDKTAYLPGSGPATFASISSYFKGINGLMIDVSTGHGTISLNDFSFRGGKNNQPDTWDAEPRPNGFVITPLNATTNRITFTWEDGSIGNAWLEVRVHANANTGLAADDVFYFGHRMGDTGLGNSAAAAITSAADVLAVRNNRATGVDVTNPFDFSRDKNVSANDELISRNWGGVLLMLNLPAPGGLQAGPLTASGTRLESEHAGESRAPGLAAVVSALSRPVAAPVVSQAVVRHEVISTRPVSSTPALNALALAIAIEQGANSSPAETATESVTSDDLLSPLLSRLGL